MGQREVTLNGERRVVDVVSHTTQSVRTPWGVVTAKPGDVLLPWGSYAVPVPEGLLGALMAHEPARNPEHAAAMEAERGLENMRRNELVRLAADKYPRAAPWFTMKREDVLKELRERGV